MKALTLDKLRTGERGTVTELLSEGSMRRRMIDLGVVEGTEIECVGKSPAGDPSAYLIRGAVIAIRARDACKVYIKVIPEGNRDGTD